MFIEKNDNPIARFKTDGYNRLSLILCTLGIFLIGILSLIYNYIGAYVFGM
jgi:NADH-quinone oxidoreductase subunit N